MASDLIIIGGGPAGLTAALYGSRGGLDTLVLEAGIPGGQVGSTDRIENYPGFPEGINGFELATKFAEQVQHFGARLEMATAKEVDFNERIKKIKTEGGEFEAGAIIIATGARPRLLGVAGEKEFSGRGVSYCATCDGAFFKDKKVAVVGGGDSAVEEALFLTRFARQVTIIHRRDALRAAVLLQERARKNTKINFHWDTVVDAIKGTERVQGLRLRNVKNNAIREEDFDGIFIFVGLEPNTAFLGSSLTLDAEGYIVTSENLVTSAAGIFAAGDVRSKEFRQVSTAVGDGAAAAMAAERYLANL